MLSKKSQRAKPVWVSGKTPGRPKNVLKELEKLNARVMKMPADLNEKVKRYEDMLKRALLKAKYAPIPESHMYAVAKDYYTMAEAYYKDGIYFLEQGDPVNALASFSYGHAWLDAGAKLGVFSVDDETLFTI